MSIARTWLKIVNVLLLLQGLVIIGGAAYVASLSISNFVWVLGAVGIYVLLVGIVGIHLTTGSGRNSNGCVKLYAVMLFTLLSLHAALVIGFLAYEDKTIQILQDLNSHGDNSAIRDYLDNHRNQFKYAALCVLIVEFLAFCAAACFKIRSSSDNDLLPLEEQYSGLNMDDRGLMSAPGYFHGAEFEVSATPQTDARRAQISEKYGGKFTKSTNYSRV